MVNIKDPNLSYDTLKYNDRAKSYSILTSTLPYELNGDKSKIYGFKLRVLNQREVSYGINVEAEKIYFATAPEMLDLFIRDTSYIIAIDEQEVAVGTIQNASIYAEETGQRISEHKILIEAFSDTLRDSYKDAIQIDTIIDSIRYESKDIFIETSYDFDRLTDYTSLIDENELMQRFNALDIYLDTESKATMRESTFFSTIATEEDGHRIQQEADALVQYDSIGDRLMTVHDSLIEVESIGDRLIDTFNSTISVYEDTKRISDEFRAIEDALIDVKRDVTLESIYVYQDLGRIVAYDTQLEWLQTGSLIGESIADIDMFEELSKLSDYQTSGSGIEYSSKDMTFDSMMTDPDYGIRDVTFDSTFYYHEEATKVLIADTVFTEYDLGIRSDIFVGGMDIFEVSSKLSDYDTRFDEYDEGIRDLSFITNFDEYDLGLRNVARSTEHYLMEGSTKLSDLESIPFEFDTGYRDVLFDSQLNDIEGSTKISMYDTLEDMTDGFIKDMTYEAENVAFDNFTRDTYFDSFIEDFDIFLNGGIITVIEQFDLFTRIVEKETVVDNEFEPFIRSDKYAIITHEDFGERLTEELAMIEGIEHSFRQKIKATRVIKRDSADSIKPPFDTKVVKADSASREGIHETKVSSTSPVDFIKLPKVTKVVKSNSATRDRVKETKIVDKDSGTRLKVKQAQKLLSDSGIRNVINSANLIKTVAGDRNGEHTARIIDKGGDSSLKDKDEKLIWLIMGKMQPWSPWNWKKTR